jgi:hypothetical protein
MLSQRPRSMPLPIPGPSEFCVVPHPIAAPKSENTCIPTYNLQRTQLTVNAST